MKVLTFKEFLIAKGESNLLRYITDFNLPAINRFHRKLSFSLKEYLFVGGEPLAVEEFVRSNDYNKINNIKKEKLKSIYDYINNNSVSSKSAERCKEVLDVVKIQLADENKKFIFNRIKENAKNREYGDSIDWLINQGILLRQEEMNKNIFKLYYADVGTLSLFYGWEPKDEIDINNSALLYQFIMQEQLALGNNLMFKRSGYAKSEVPFIIENTIIDSRKTEYIPISVSRTINRKSKSAQHFNSCMERDKNIKNKKEIRLSQEPCKVDGDYIDLPIYMACQLSDINLLLNN